MVAAPDAPAQPGLCDFRPRFAVDVEVLDHSTESVGGIKKVEALGALKLLSGGSARLAAVDTCTRRPAAT